MSVQGITLPIFGETHFCLFASCYPLIFILTNSSMSNLFVQVVQEWGFPQVAPYRWLNATWNLGVNFSQLSSRTTLGPLIMAKDQFRQYLVGAFKYVLFSPRTLRKWSNLTCACFQTGWFNHHLDIVASNIHTKPQKKQNDLAKIPRLGGWRPVIKKSLTSDSTILGSLVIMVRHYRSAQEGMTTKNIYPMLTSD